MSAPILVGLLASGVLGAGLGRLLRLPIWPMTGAITGAALFHLAVGGGVNLPWWWSFVAQVAIGSTVGSRLGPNVLRDFRAILGPGIVAMVVMISAGIGFGLVVWTSGQAGLAESVFGMVPGGVGEMVAAVTSLNGDGALVASMHLVRLLMTLFVVNLAVRWLRRRGKTRAGGSAGYASSRRSSPGSRSVGLAEWGDEPTHPSPRAVQILGAGHPNTVCSWHSDPPMGRGIGDSESGRDAPGAGIRPPRQ